jgi:hypothetical protein
MRMTGNLAWDVGEAVSVAGPPQAGMKISINDTNIKMNILNISLYTSEVFPQSGFLNVNLIINLTNTLCLHHELLTQGHSSFLIHSGISISPFRRKPESSIFTTHSGESRNPEGVGRRLLHQLMK